MHVVRVAVEEVLDGGAQVRLAGRVEGGIVPVVALHDADSHRECFIPVHEPVGEPWSAEHAQESTLERPIEFSMKVHFPQPLDNRVGSGDFEQLGRHTRRVG